jgi:hypothetical protein
MGYQREHKNKVDYGIKNYRKFYELKYNNGNSCKNYTKIIGEFNKQLIQLILNEDLTYYIPYLGMEIMIKKEKKFIRMKDNKVINPKPIDWKSTKELWEKDDEAKEKKIRLRYNNYHTSGYIFRIYLKKFKSRLKFRSYFKIKPNRTFQRGLAQRINDPNKDSFDAFLLYKHKEE